MPAGVSLGTFKIRDIWFLRIVQAIWSVHIGDFDLIIFTDTMIKNQAYFRNRLGYNVVFLLETTAVDGGAQGRVGLVVRYRPQGWSI